MKTPDAFYKNEAFLKGFLEKAKKNNFSEFIRLEKALFHFSKDVDFLVYKNSLVDFLYENTVNSDYVTYVEKLERNIAVYPGSFNPFTTGHYSILEKAEKIFDKVIIAFGNNADKKNEKYEIPQAIMNRQIEHYDGLITSFLDKLGYETTLIRGLRNASDFYYEINLERCLKDENRNIKFVSIFCDAEFEHVSSSVSRQYEKFGKKMYRI